MNVSINSTHILNNIKSTIIRLTSIISIEKQIPVDEAKVIVCGMLFKEYKNLLSNEIKTNIINIKYELKQKIMNKTITDIEREIIQLFGEIKL